MNILIDTNIVIDVALKREPHFEKAMSIFRLLGEEENNGFLSATTVTDIFYVTRKSGGKQAAKDFLLELLDLLNIIGIDKIVIENALKSNILDFEDAVQIKAAEHSNMDAIVTRNKKDFVDSKVPIYEPQELIKFLSE